MREENNALTHPALECVLHRLVYQLDMLYPDLARGTEGGIFRSSGCDGTASASGVGCPRGCAVGVLSTGAGALAASTTSGAGADGDEVGVGINIGILRSDAASGHSRPLHRPLPSRASGPDPSGAGEEGDCVVVLGDEQESGPGPGPGVGLRVSEIGAGTGIDVGEDDIGGAADDGGAGGTWASPTGGGGVMVVGAVGWGFFAAAPHVHFSMNHYCTPDNKTVRLDTVDRGELIGMLSPQAPVACSEIYHACEPSSPALPKQNRITPTYIVSAPSVYCVEHAVPTRAPPVGAAGVR